MDFQFDKPEIEKLFRETAKSYIENYPEQFDGSGIAWPESAGWFDEEMLVLELITIKDWEKIFKREAKKGAVSMAMFFNEEGLDKNKFIENRTFARCYGRPITEGSCTIPEGHHLLRIINSVDGFNITF